MSITSARRSAETLAREMYWKKPPRVIIDIIICCE